jgi:hypothetical protein
LFVCCNLIFSYLGRCGRTEDCELSVKRMDTMLGPGSGTIINDVCNACTKRVIKLDATREQLYGALIHESTLTIFRSPVYFPGECTIRFV